MNISTSIIFEEIFFFPDKELPLHENLFSKEMYQRHRYNLANKNVLCVSRDEQQKHIRPFFRYFFKRINGEILFLSLAESVHREINFFRAILTRSFKRY